MRRKALVAVATVIMSLGIMQAAWAVGGTVTIRFNHDTEVFHGKVESPNMECRVGRAVKLYKVTADGRQLQGKVRTSDSGSWKIELMHAHGQLHRHRAEVRGACTRRATGSSRARWT